MTTALHTQGEEGSELRKHSIIKLKKQDLVWF